MIEDNFLIFRFQSKCFLLNSFSGPSNNSGIFNNFRSHFFSPFDGNIKFVNFCLTRNDSFTEFRAKYFGSEKYAAKIKWVYWKKWYFFLSLV